MVAAGYLGTMQYFKWHRGPACAGSLPYSGQLTSGSQCTLEKERLQNMEIKQRRKCHLVPQYLLTRLARQCHSYCLSSFCNQIAHFKRLCFKGEGNSPADIFQKISICFSNPNQGPSWTDKQFFITSLLCKWTIALHLQVHHQIPSECGELYLKNSDGFPECLNPHEAHSAPQKDLYLLQPQGFLKALAM